MDQSDSKSREPHDEKPRKDEAEPKFDRRAFLVGAAKKAAYITPAVMVLGAQQTATASAGSTPSCLANGDACDPLDDQCCAPGMCTAVGHSGMYKCQ